MSNLLNVSFKPNPFLNNEEIKEAIENQQWSFIQEIEVESDHFNFSFEQKNKFRQLMMEALQKVSNMDPVVMATSAEKIIHYLTDLWKRSKSGVDFETWFENTYPSLGVLGKMITTGNIEAFGSLVVNKFAQNEGLSTFSFVDHVNQLWELKEKRAENPE